MHNWVPFLHLCYSFSIFWIDVVLGIERRENPANSFKSQTLGQKINLVFIIVFENVEARILSHLRWFVNCFDIDSNSIWIVWVFWVVSVKPSYSLLYAMVLLPIAHKLLHFWRISNWHIVNMSVELSFEHNWWRNAFIAHPLRIWFMAGLTI